MVKMIPTGNKNLDKLLGLEGGIPPGAIIGIEGTVGVGATSLLTTIAAGVVRQGLKVQYFDPDGSLTSVLARKHPFLIGNNRLTVSTIVRDSNSFSKIGNGFDLTIMDNISMMVSVERDPGDERTRRHTAISRALEAGMVVAKKNLDIANQVRPEDRVGSAFIFSYVRSLSVKTGETAMPRVVNSYTDRGLLLEREGDCAKIKVIRSKYSETGDLYRMHYLTGAILTEEEYLESTTISRRSRFDRKVEI